MIRNLLFCAALFAISMSPPAFGQSVIDLDDKEQSEPPVPGEILSRQGGDDGPMIQDPPDNRRRLAAPADESEQPAVEYRTAPVIVYVPVVPQAVYGVQPQFPQRSDNASSSGHSGGVRHHHSTPASQATAANRPAKPWTSPNTSR